ncbi:MAG: P-II family nitrogen regulator [Candidatus Marinimicrobia bacterium]|nr:P-II family nitrogen regulator [Candidatus Neomarinimicrobiota bacterium]MCF7839968.1 P-II family nitrogen regulator [Candidatus Neomarinimicrobiota bacterium]MCF7903265.1 P-II family nitrogen regulator [Candidatus Neomarinimicrobiota bacterium]
MKEIKAYIRTKKVEKTIHALERIGIQDLTVIDVMALGQGMLDREQYKYSMEFVERYSTIAKLEIICANNDSEQIVQTIRSIAYTGEKGDGLILVSPVEFAQKIRSGKTGESIVQV